MPARSARCACEFCSLKIYEAVAKNFVAKLTHEICSSDIARDEETSSIQAKSQHRRVSRILCAQMLATIRSESVHSSCYFSISKNGAKLSRACSNDRER